MRTIYKTELVYEAMAKTRISDCFDICPDCIKIFQYQKGELIISPMTKNSHLLVALDGEYMIYQLDEKGNISFSTKSMNETLLGDSEMLLEDYQSLFVEAVRMCRFLAIPYDYCLQQMETNTKFLRYLLYQIELKTVKMSNRLFSRQPLKEQLLFYIKNLCPDRTLTNVGHAAEALHCSTRQILRILKEECDHHVLIKQGKGNYKYCGT